MTTEELIKLLQDLEVPEEESASLISLVAEQGWTDEVKSQVTGVIDEYTALKQEEIGVLEKTKDIVAARDQEIAQIEGDTADDITDAADEADAAIKAVEDGLGEIDKEFSSQMNAAESAAPAPVAPAAPAPAMAVDAAAPLPEPAPIAPVAPVAPAPAMPAAPVQAQPFGQ